MLAAPADGGGDGAPGGGVLVGVILAPPALLTPGGPRGATPGLFGTSPHLWLRTRKREQDSSRHQALGAQRGHA
eukprot:4147725-Alexandrium_andersonii.AAC.1